MPWCCLEHLWSMSRWALPVGEKSPGPLLSTARLLPQEEAAGHLGSLPSLFPRHVASPYLPACQGICLTPLPSLFSNWRASKVFRVDAFSFARGWSVLGDNLCFPRSCVLSFNNNNRTLLVRVPNAGIKHHDQGSLRRKRFIHS